MQPDKHDDAPVANVNNSPQDSMLDLRDFVLDLKDLVLDFKDAESSKTWSV